AAELHLVGQSQGRRGKQRLRGRIPRPRQHRPLRPQQEETDGHVEQSDGTSWVAMYTLNMLAIAMELADEDPSYEDIASKFWEHFLYIANAMSDRGNSLGLWNEADGFFHDVLHTADNNRMPLKVRSVVGLIPLLAVETLEPADLVRFEG